jgi:GDP-L-fucose synthase
MPTNLYGPGDNYHPENSHVIPGLLRRFHEAMHTGADQVTIWGSGTPRREFLHVDDMAAACVHVMELAPVVYQAHTRPMLSHINVGTGTDVTIRELAETIARVTGFPGRLALRPRQARRYPAQAAGCVAPQGPGLGGRIGLEEGLRDAYGWYQRHAAPTP